MAGWIALHRQIMNSWIYQDAKYFKWWCTILMNVNHEKSQFPVGTTLHDCRSGESFRSIEAWAGLFGCSKRTALKFLQLLESDNMVTRKIIGKGNRRKHLLTVVNWEEYQVKSNPKMTRKGNRKSTPNNNENNENNKILMGEIDRIYKAYPSRCPFRDRATSKSSRDKEKIETLLKTHSADELVELINLYVEDSKKSESYISNFSTFLNNLPDKESFRPSGPAVNGSTVVLPPVEVQS